MSDSNLKKRKNTKKIMKKKFVNQVFSNVSMTYDFMNDLMSFGLHRTWKEKVVSLLEIYKDSLVLDLASGSGDISKKIKEKCDCKCIALDANMEMLEIAKKRNNSFEPFYIYGNAENLPFKKSIFDYVVVSFGLRNFNDIPKSLRQIHRVLKSNGTFICLEFSEVNNPIFRKVIMTYFKAIPRLGQLFADNKFAYDYLVESILNFPNQIQLTKKLTQAGFQTIQVIDIIDGVASIHISKKQ
ncbi:MAG: bifunctional demethylmenaquinone methyltransferase/2-methoxy-6-polyprenyl-1,4-benzoquinol methylase [Rickettsiales bacterium]|nr:bifunctional demethylmenaquinone methyltransferase/2-methoxy-6-polyprenyl-1,4-benzoquinol methylase [Rickettsiales bacterium]